MKPITLEEFKGFLMDTQGAWIESNLARALACVNACQGLGTKALEAGALAALLDEIRDAHWFHDAMDRLEGK